MVSQTKSLRNLNLKNCLQTFEDARGILKSVICNKTLKSLNVSGSKMNLVDFEFGAIIGRILKANENLLHLDISYCKLSSYDLVFVILCLMDNETLVGLHMGGNILDTKTSFVLKALLGES